MAALIPDLILSILLLYPLYLIFKRAGLNSNFAFLVLMPFFGALIVAVILRQKDWKLSNSKGANQ